MKPNTPAECVAVGVLVAEGAGCVVCTDADVSDGDSLDSSSSTGNSDGCIPELRAASAEAWPSRKRVSTA